MQVGNAAREGRLNARPRTPATSGRAGLRRLGLDDERDALIYVPEREDDGAPAPVAVMLHGAGGVAEHGIALLASFADATGLILLAPPSRASTWDIIRGAYGADIAFIDRALERTFEEYSVDRLHVAIGGFSDGASYALSVGLTNGLLFTHVIAFSPGFVAPGTPQGLPRTFVSHGTNDAVLPIDRCSRRIVPPLRRAGYDVLYREFDGPHTVPATIAQEAVAWYLSDRA